MDHHLRKPVRLGVVLLGIVSFAFAMAMATAAEPSVEVVLWNPWEPAAYLGGRVGYLEVEGVDVGSLNVGFFGGFEIREFLALEGSLDYHTSDYDSGDRATLALQASLRVYPLPFLRRFRPYGVGGIGYYYSDYDLYASESYSPSSDRDADGGFHAGGGFDIAIPQIRAEEDVFVTFDVRYLFTHKSENDLRKIKADGILATVGIKMRF